MARFTPDMFRQLPFKELGETNDPAWSCGPAKYELLSQRVSPELTGQNIGSQVQNLIQMFSISYTYIYQKV